MITIWGLKNCDTCRKALKWLEAEGIAYRFIDVRKDDLDISHLQKWVDDIGIERLINRRGTTWRGLSEDIKENVDEKNAPQLLLEHPALMKRPIWEIGLKNSVGFTDDVKTELISFCK